MRRIDLLITQSRRSTENLEFTEESGIQDSEIIQYFNDAQDDIQTVIQNLFPDVFQEEKEISAVASQEAYSIPNDAFLGERIDMLEYSRTGQIRDYYILPKGHKRERLVDDTGDPIFYIRRSGQFLVQPAPQSGGKFRILYQRRRPRLDTRRAKVLAVTLTGTSITALTFDTSELLDDTTLLSEGYMTIVDKDGEQQMRSIPVSAINTITGVVTVEPGFSFESGETIAVGDYAVSGADSTTHPQMPEICEKHLLEYVNMRLMIRDSSSDSGDIAQLLSRIEGNIRMAFSEPDGDINLIPVINTEYLDYEGS